MMNIIFSSILSGMLISFGGMLFICSKWIYDSEIMNLIGSILFSSGLLTICYFKLHLFTGKVGLLFEHVNEWEGCNAVWKLMLILVLNLISAIIFGIIAHLALRKTYFTTIISNITSNKLTYTSVNLFIKCFLQSFYCGSCVHFAVKTFPLHFIFCVFFISGFVYNGFQHCIANAFYFGALFKFDINMLINEFIVISGNILGTIPIACIHNKIHD